MDIATLLESHRRYMLEALQGLNNQEVDDIDIEHAHDRATTKTLLDMYRSGNGQQPVGQASATTPAATPSRGVKPGSKAARQRALKAGETRRNNLAKGKAAKIDDGFRTGQPVDITTSHGEPALSPATHLVPRPPEGGAA